MQSQITKITTGSSETIRKTAFNFSDYRERLVSHKKSGKIDSAFLEWLVGFSEGDGFFIVSKGRLFFIINQKEEKVLHRIRTELGFGKVSTYNTYSRFIVADRDNIERLIHLFNGNLVLHKTNSQFELWLQSWNLSSREQKRVSLSLKISYHLLKTMVGCLDLQTPMVASMRCKQETLDTVLDGGSVCDLSWIKSLKRTC